MKTITKENLSVYLFEDTETLAVTVETITVGDPVRFVVADCNSTNTVLHEGVTAPVDWVGGKYFFDGTDWTLNPDWVDPEPVDQQPV